MSFDLNLTSSNFKPKVESTFLGKGGGGGNTGYFQQERKKEDEKEQNIMSKYLSEDKLDKIASQGIEDLQEDNKGILDRFKNIISKFN